MNKCKFHFPAAPDFKILFSFLSGDYHSFNFAPAEWEMCLLAVWRRAGEETRALSLGHCVSLNKTLLACL